MSYLNSLGQQSLCHITFLCAILCFFAPNHAAEKPTSQEASQSIESLHQALISIMKLEAKSHIKKRVKTLGPAVKKNYDIAGILKYSIGKAEWSKLTEAQQKQLVEALADYTIASYASRFGNFKGEKFQTKKHFLQGNSAVVMTEFTTSKGEVKHFNYQLRHKDERWQIINVMVNNVSDLATKKAEYSDIIKKEGHTGLLRTLKRKQSEQLASVSK